MPVIAVAVVAAGRGERAGGGVPKQFRDLAGKPLLRWSLERFARRRDVARIIVAIPAGEDARFDALADGVEPRPQAVTGGASRTASVRASLERLAEGERPDIVLVHDAARPFASDELIERIITALTRADGAAPGLAPTDALKEVDAAGRLGGDVPRAGVRAVQTPQGFRFDALLKAYRALPEDADLADDIAAALAAGVECVLVDGDPGNVKITSSDDFARAEARLRPMTGPSAAEPRIAAGFGFDAHRLVAGDGVMLCGVKLPGDLALAGHSDADAALHAVTDALLGAIGAGDIGEHFPPSDPQWAGADSRVFVRRALELLAAAGGRVLHADVTIICERPKVKPHRAAMRASLAEILGVEAGAASVKATTTEGMGFTGRGEGVAVQAIVTVSRG